MKKLLLGLSLVALLAGCASHENQNGMGGTDEDYNKTKTDEYNTNNNYNSSDQFNNNATQAPGATTPNGANTPPP